MKVQSILLHMLFLIISCPLFSEELICGEEPEYPKDSIYNENYWKQMEIYDEWRACNEYESLIVNGVWIPQTVWGLPEVIKFTKKRKLSLKGLDVKLKNLPKDWIVYKLRYPRDQQPLDRIDCPDHLYYIAIGNRPIITLACSEPILYNGDKKSDLEKWKGIKFGKKFSHDFGPKDGKYYREVFEWVANSYKTKNYTCNASCTALVDFEYKDWFLKNIYFRLE